jgi:HAD superfamily hydrolase (TIGR01509 family)
MLGIVFDIPGNGCLGDRMTGMGKLAIRAMVFDMGGVFLHPAAGRPTWIGAGSSVPEGLLAASAWNSDESWEIYKRGGMDEETYWRGRQASLGADGPTDWTDLRDWWDSAVRLDRDLVALARQLAERLTLAALSNAGAELERRLDTFGIADLFAVVVNSHRVGMAKPEAGIYRHVADKLQLKLSDLLLVDDKPRNTDAAGTLGMHTHIYRTAALLADDLARRFAIA